MQKYEHFDHDDPDDHGYHEGDDDSDDDEDGPGKACNAEIWMVRVKNAGTDRNAAFQLVDHDHDDDHNDSLSRSISAE